MMIVTNEKTGGITSQAFPFKLQEVNGLAVMVLCCKVVNKEKIRSCFMLAEQDQCVHECGQQQYSLSAGGSHQGCRILSHGDDCSPLPAQDQEEPGACSV